MNNILTAVIALATASVAQAALKPGDSLTPYEIKNVSNGKEYCQVCAYGAKAAKIVAFGKLNDAAFWSDLRQLQKLQTDYKDLGVFAQIIDSTDTSAIKKEAEKHGVTFPVVIAVGKDWDKAYQVNGVSRTIYYAQRNNKILWTSVGLKDASFAQLQEKVKNDVKG